MHSYIVDVNDCECPRLLAYICAPVCSGPMLHERALDVPMVAIARTASLKIQQADASCSLIGTQQATWRWCVLHRSLAMVQISRSRAIFCNHQLPLPIVRLVSFNNNRWLLEAFRFQSNILFAAVSPESLVCGTRVVSSVRVMPPKQQVVDPVSLKKEIPVYPASSVSFCFLRMNFCTLLPSCPRHCKLVEHFSRVQDAGEVTRLSIDFHREIQYILIFTEFRETNPIDFRMCLCGLAYWVGC